LTPAPRSVERGSLDALDGPEGGGWSGAVMGLSISLFGSCAYGGCRTGTR
jgi:hypothetical protein